VTGSCRCIERAGLREGDLIVAVDGIAVSSTTQFDVLYDRSFDAPLTLTIWRKNGYIILETTLRRDSLRPGLKVYEAPNAT
jgi:S1-C subfamily serine protease